MTKILSFEESIAELENIVKQLELGELSLESSIEKFKQGIALSQNCDSILTKAVQEVEMVLNTHSLPPLHTQSGLDRDKQ